MIKDGFLGGPPWVGRIKKRRNNLLWRVGTFRRGDRSAKEESAEQEGCEYVFQ
jgi:hypothetical protein